MKLFAVGFVLIANLILANGLALKGGSRAVSIQQSRQDALPSASLTEQQEEEQPQPKPYSFSYQSESDLGSSSRSENSDTTGKVIGKYTILGNDGLSRVVEYVADKNGFQANVTTNEPGTENQNPSFIVIKTSQQPAAEISRQLQVEADLAAQEEEQPSEGQSELPPPPPPAAAPAPTRTINNSRKGQPAKSRRQPAAQPAPQSAPQQQVAVKSKRPSQQPAKRVASVSNPSKGATRSRNPTKSVVAPITTTTTTTTTTQRPRISSQPAKRLSVQQQPQPQEEDAQISSLSADQDEALEDDSQEGF